MTLSRTNEWPMVELGEICIPPERWKKKDSKNYEYIDISSLDNTIKQITVTQQISSTSAPSRATTHVATDDVLVSTVRPNLNAVALVPTEMPAAIASSGLSVLRARQDIVDPHYLFHLVQSPWFIQQCCDLATGASYPAVSDAKIRRITVPLPPLAEQQRIAEILDRSQSLMDDSIKMERKCDALLRAYFISRFGHPLDPANSIPRQAIGSISHVITGNTPPRKDPSNYGKSLEWLKSDNLGNLWPTSAAESLSSKGAEKARVVEEGAVLVTCIAGSRESIGKSSLLNRKAAFNQQINAIVPSASLEPFFLFAQIKAAPELIRRQATDGMKGIVSKKTLESVEILVPPLDLQRNFAAVVADIAGLKERAQQRINHFRNLYHSLSTRAFASQL